MTTPRIELKGRHGLRLTLHFDDRPGYGWYASIVLRAEQVGFLSGSHASRLRVSRHDGRAVVWLDHTGIHLADEAEAQRAEEFIALHTAPAAVEAA